MAHTAKADLATIKVKLKRRLRDLCAELNPGCSALEEDPPPLIAHRKRWPDLADGQRPAFAAAAMAELIDDIVDELIPQHLVTEYR
jgi:hypothetical protein